MDEERWRTVADEIAEDFANGRKDDDDRKAKGEIDEADAPF
jgi:hypothetical protein